MSIKTAHPKGLYLLFATEMWERFSYYGMRAIFILYMTQALLFNKELASEIYGSYTGLVYLTPLIGGYIADRYWGNRRSIIVGALIMALGQFLMFLSACDYEQPAVAVPLMFAGLAALILGNGFFKPNISTLVGDLYAPSDHRKDSAFTIFYMGVNVGSFIAPLWCGFVGDTGNPSDFKWGFLSACIGMVIGTLLFWTLKNRYVVTPEGRAIGMPPAKSPQTAAQQPDVPASKTRIAATIFGTALLVVLFSLNYGYFQGNGTLFEQADFIGPASMPSASRCLCSSSPTRA